MIVPKEISTHAGSPENLTMQSPVEALFHSGWQNAQEAIYTWRKNSSKIIVVQNFAANNIPHTHDTAIVYTNSSSNLLPHSLTYQTDSIFSIRGVVIYNPGLSDSERITLATK